MGGQTAAFGSVRSSAARVTSATARLSSRCATDEVPGDQEHVVGAGQQPGQLVLQRHIRPGRPLVFVHAPQVDSGQPVGLSRPQVLLHAGTQLGGGAGREPATLLITPCPTFDTRASSAGTGAAPSGSTRWRPTGRRTGPCRCGRRPARPPAKAPANASSRSRGGPITPGPGNCIAPYPIRRSVWSARVSVSVTSSKLPRSRVANGLAGVVPDRDGTGVPGFGRGPLPTVTGLTPRRRRSPEPLRPGRRRTPVRLPAPARRWPAGTPPRGAGR